MDKVDNLKLQPLQITKAGKEKSYKVINENETTVTLTQQNHPSARGNEKEFTEITKIKCDTKIVIRQPSNQVEENIAPSHPEISSKFSICFCV